jgi:hypothetical protein
MAVAFWSIKLTTNGDYVEVQPPEGFVLTITVAALDPETEGKGSHAVKLDTVAIEGESLTSVICTLRPEALTQFNLNLVLGYDVPTKFYLVSSKGSKGTVYLSGYYQPAPEDGKPLLFICFRHLLC